MGRRSGGVPSQLREEGAVNREEVQGTREFGPGRPSRVTG